MKTHCCGVVVKHDTMSADAIKRKVEAGNALNEKDGIEVVKAMIGRRFANTERDRELEKLFKKTWMISENSLATILMRKTVN